MKICKDCKWYDENKSLLITLLTLGTYPFEESKCLHDDSRSVDRVTGEVSYCYCFTERGYDCGHIAKNFEAKE